MPGTVACRQSEQGHVTLTVTPGEGVSMFPLSSTARDMIVVVGALRDAHV